MRLLYIIIGLCLAGCSVNKATKEWIDPTTNETYLKVKFERTTFLVDSHFGFTNLNLDSETMAEVKDANSVVNDKAVKALSEGISQGIVQGLKK